MIIMGIFQLGLPYVMHTFALRRVIARDAALISLLEPLLNPIWVFLLIRSARQYDVRWSMLYCGGDFISFLW